MDRRTFIGTASATAIAGLAGCSSAVGAIPKPQVSDEKLSDGGWEQVDDATRTVLEESYRDVTLTADARTVLYEDAELRERIGKETLGSVSATLSVFFATRLEFAPDLNSLPGGIGQDEINAEVESDAKQSFKDQLRNRGIENVTESDTRTLTVDTGEDVTLTEYEAEYIVSEMEFPVGNGESVTIKRDAITINGFLGVWNHGDYTLISGGAYPAENFTDDVTEELSDAITVNVDIDLGLQPSKYQDEIEGLFKTVR